MSKTAQSVWENCLAFIKDNIQDQAFKTWFRPIKSVELTDNTLHSGSKQILLRMARRALC